ncbi:hypothetical protein C6502_13255 [Candidatus Poribacteria bacterium]|nr:MAG: hypothetical protein C6502_13255 [Candidatus Poribacteria bacterium]
MSRSFLFKTGSKVELEQNQTSIDEKRTVIEDQLSTLRENHDLNAAKGEFESDADYAARLRQLNEFIAQRRTELESEHLSPLLERRLEIQAEIARLHRQGIFH